MKPETDKRMEETLNSLDGIQRAEPQPFFYTRLIGRLQRNEKTVWVTMGSFLARPVVAVAGLCFILVLNAFILIERDGNNSSSLTDQTELVTDNDYIIASSSSFDYENIDQQ